MMAPMHTGGLIVIDLGFLAALVASVIRWRRTTPREREEEKGESQLW
ncbi:MAG TPA: hypothetical protein VMU87_16340 [Stellaceae bacterium]|nr:hypothetical protein [Stellaceae bacterium]